MILDRLLQAAAEANSQAAREALDRMPECHRDFLAEAKALFGKPSAVRLDLAGSRVWQHGEWAAAEPPIE